MSHSIKVDAGLMREHKAHDLLIADGPVRNPGPSGAFLGLLIAFVIWAVVLVGLWLRWK
jgi:hypothetical protein